MSLLVIAICILLSICLASISGLILECIPGPIVDSEFALFMFKIALLSGTLCFGLILFI